MDSLPPGTVDFQAEVLILTRVTTANSPARIAAALEVNVEDVRSALESLAALGYIERASDATQTTQYSLTQSGRIHLLKLAAQSRDTFQPESHSTYARFVALDDDFKRLALRHVPSRYGPTTPSSALRRDLANIHLQIDAFLGDIDRWGTRFASYRRRLGASRNSVERGSLAHLASPLVDSFHSIWFELHEDLLVTLGEARTE